MADPFTAAALFDRAFQLGDTALGATLGGSLPPNQASGTQVAPFNNAFTVGSASSDTSSQAIKAVVPIVMVVGIAWAITQVSR